MAKFRSLIDSLTARLGGETDCYKTEWRPDHDATFADIKDLLPDAVRIGLWSGNNLVDELDYHSWMRFDDKKVWLVWFEDGAVCVDIFKH